MSNRRSYMCDWKLGAGGAAVLTLVVGVLLAGSPAAGEKKPEPTPSSAVPAPQRGIPDPTPSTTPSAPIGGPQEGGAGLVPSSASGAPQSAPQGGVKVHGHWTIEIRDPDGTVVTRREFDNALVSNGGLPALLARQATIGLWTVTISGLPFPCGPAEDPGGPCIIIEGSSTAPAQPNILFKTLTVVAPTGSQPNAGRLVLSGAAIAFRSTRINTVATGNARCPATRPPASNCEAQTLNLVTSFTQGPVNPPVEALKDQQIQVTVVLSFS